MPGFDVSRGEVHLIENTLGELVNVAVCDVPKVRNKSWAIAS